MKEIREFIYNVTGISFEVQNKILLSIVIIAVLWLILFIILKISRRRTDDIKKHYVWRKTFTYLAVILGIFFVGRIWFNGFKEIGTYLGLLSAGLAIALNEPVKNIAGWLFIILRRPFKVGDRIQIGDFSGDVIDIRIFQFSLLEIGNWVNADQSTGRITHVPNGKIFTDTLASYSQGFEYIWNELPILITFESNWEKAKKILTKIANENSENLSESAKKKILKASRKFMIFYTYLTPTVYTNIQDSGVMLTIRYLCDPRNRRGSAEKILEAILEQFSKNDDIEFAYPTQRFYNARNEGSNLNKNENSYK